MLPELSLTMFLVNEAKLVWLVLPYIVKENPKVINVPDMVARTFRHGHRHAETVFLYYT